MLAINNGCGKDDIGKEGGNVMRRLKLRVMVLGMLSLLSLLLPLQAIAATYISSIAIDPSAGTITRPATSTSYTLTFTPGGDGNGAAVLSVENLPAGVSWQLNSPELALTNKMKEFTRMLTLTAASSVAEGSYPFTVRVVSNSSIEATAQGTLTVAKMSQTITSFAFSEAELNVDGPTTATVSATGGGSGNPVVFSSLTPAVCTVSGSTVSAVVVGTCTVAANQAGNDDYSAAVQVTGSIQIVDNTPPVLNVSMLSDGAVTRRLILNITGSATDASGIKEILLNGESVPQVNGKFDEALELIDGENIIEMVAVDNNNKETVVTQRVFFDVDAPYLNVTAPADNSTTVDSSLNITGTVDGLCAVDVIVNGQQTYTATIDGQNFTAAGVQLSPGMNTIEVVAEDANGNLSSVKRSVYSDMQGLTLQVSTPSEDSFVYVDNTIQGTVGGFQGNVAVTLGVNGQTYNPLVTSGAFQQSFKLPALRGLYTVDVTATDDAGHTSSVQRNLVKIDLATLTSNPSTASVTKGTPVAFTAGLAGGGTYEYRYAISAVYGNKNTVATEFSASNTWTWDTASFPVNTYLVSVALRDPVTKQRVASLSKNIVVTSPGAATGATLVADKPNLMQKGGVVTFTGGAKSSVNIEYRFTLTLDGVTKASRSWGGNIWQWNTGDANYPPGRYIVWVSARNIGSSATAETSTSMDFTIVADAPAKWLKVSVNQPSPKQKGGSPVVVTATATSAVPIEYLFKVKLGTASAETVRNWSTSNAWQWDTSLATFPPGVYTVYVYCRNVGSVASYETFSSFNYTLVAASP